MYGEAMPELPPTESMADMWRELGLAQMTMHGPSPFDWVQVDAFARLAGYAISPIEAHCLMDMSRAYVNGLADTNPFSIAPMERGDD